MNHMTSKYIIAIKRQIKQQLETQKMKSPILTFWQPVAGRDAGSFLDMWKQTAAPAALLV